MKSAALFCALISLVLCGAPGAAAQPPNVLVILADDLGFSDLGCYGGEIPTPNLDRLATGGAKFSAFYTSARCCPSRASLMTGLHPHQAGIGSFAHRSQPRGQGLAYKGSLLPSCATMAELLGDAGYSTWMVGKWHMGSPGPVERGFANYFGYRNFLAYAEDQWEAESYVRLPEGSAQELPPGDEFYATDFFNDYALEFLEQAREREDQPWMLYLAHSSPHFPVQAPRESIDKHVDTYRRGWDVLRAERFARQKQLGLIDANAQLPPRAEVPVDRDDIANGFSGKPNPAWDSLPAERREDLARRMATFAAMVEHIDRGVGRILADLEKHGELENTLIVFLSDNGACYEWGPFGFDGPSRKGLTKLHTGAELDTIGQAGTHQSYGSAWANLGNTPLSMYKHFCHEGGIASPLILHWPRGIKPRDGWVETPAHLMDIVPTVLAAAGSDYPQSRAGRPITPVEGISLLPAVAGEELPERILAFEHQGARGLRKGDWKIVWGKRQPETVDWELYKLDDDRCEQHNLAEHYPAIAAELAADWERWARRVGAAPFIRPEPGFVKREKPASPEVVTPLIAGREILIQASVESQHPHGVVLAQGGREHGYALHFIDGVAALDVRVNGKVRRVKAKEKSSGKVELEASITAQTLELTAAGGPVRAPSPGLIPVEPKDKLSIGEDTLSAAGDYAEGNRFNGRVIEHKITVSAPQGQPVPEIGAGAKIATPAPLAELQRALAAHQDAVFVKSGWIRDPFITLGPDEHFYLTGTTPLPGDPREQADPYNSGLGEESIVGWKAQVWRSKDLAGWESLGTPFHLGDGIWPKAREHAFRSDSAGWRLWAPELHWLGDRWAIIHTSPSPVRGANLSLTKGDKLDRPWRNPMQSAIGRRHDPSLFADDDGTWWMIWGATMIAPLNAEFTGFTRRPQPIAPAGDAQQMGHEGCLIRKIGGKYLLFGTGWSTGTMRKGSYNLYYATADQITGPYGERQFAGRFLGHGTPFQDREGRWWCTAFYNANTPPLPPDGIGSRDLSADAQTINQQGLTLVPLEVSTSDDGSLTIRAKDPRYAMPGPDESQQFEH